MNKTGHFGFVKAVARTDVGKKRKNNEDAFGVFHEAGVFCVADGMGGGDDGEIASAAVVKGLEDGLKRLAFREDGGYAAADVADVIESSLTRASAWIFNRTRTKKLSGCGSTFVGFALDATSPGTALAVHAGDSRLYLLHGRSIKQITHDHSVAEMIGAKDESKVNPMFRSMVMNAIGIRAKAEPERTPFKVAAGDRILVCSDGLSRMVPDKKILAVSRKNEDVSKAAEALIAAALEAGGIDNVTVVLAEIGELPAAIPALEPPPEPSGEESSDSSDRATGTTGDEATEDSEQTLATMGPTVTGDGILIPEAEETVDADTGAGETRPSEDAATLRRPQVRGGRKTLLVVGVAVGVVLLVFLVLGVFAKRQPAQKGESPAAQPVQPPAAVATVPAVPPCPAPVQKAEAVVKPCENGRAGVPSPAADGDGTPSLPGSAVTSAVPIPKPQPVSKPQPLPKPLPVPEVRPVPAAVTNVPAVVTNVSAVVTNVPVAKPSRPVAEAFEQVVKACEGDSLAAFCQTFRRLEGGVKPELNEQMKRFEASARFCVRMRSKDGAVRAVVDLKYCLGAASGARKALEARNRAGVRKLLADWDALVEGEPSSDESMAAASRLMTEMQEFGNR